MLALGRLDGVSTLLPDKSLFLYSYVRKEAVMSSQIEGTQSSLSDLLLFELDEAPGVPLDDVVEVSHYVAALDRGLARLREGFPLSNRLIRDIHGVLLSRGRGSAKDPGEFRRSQNWIGGNRPGNAVFVPPHSAVPECMGQLERFLHASDDGLPALAGLGARAPVKTLDEFIARGEFHPALRSGLLAAQKMADPLGSAEYKQMLLRRNDLRQAVMTVIAANKLDALLYPHQKRLVVPIGEEQVERNGVLSNGTGFPAVTFPGGFSPPSSSAPIGVPIGLEILGPEWSEPTLLKLAYAYQEGASVRRPPASTPPLR